MRIQTREITLLVFAKISILGIFLNYFCYNILKGTLIPYGTVVFYLIASACVIVTALREEIRLSSEIVCWILYAVFSLVTSVFAIDSSAAIKGIGEFVQRLFLICMIAYICEKEKSIIYAIRLLAFTAIACMISSLLMSESTSVKLTMVSGASVSTNDIGALMAFGCFAILFAFGTRENRRLYKTILKIVYIIGAVSVIFIAGSRKSILAILLFFIFMFLLCAQDVFKDMSAARLIVITLLILAATIFVYYYLLPNVESTDMYRSVFGDKVSSKAESDQSRRELYTYAFNHFLEHPVWGLGFRNFQVVHSIYSHSTYAEPIACSGMGALLYLVPYATILVKQIKLIVLNKDCVEDRLWQKQLLAFYISFLFVGIGIPYIYKDIPCIILAMFIASQKISFARIQGTDDISASEGDYSEQNTNQSITNYS